jgi:hypothetical protein
MDNDMQRARRLRSRTYQEILSDVRNNDFDTTALAACEYTWPVGYGRELGEALSHNTIVSTLVLNVNDIVDGMEEAKEYTASSAKQAEGVSVWQGFEGAVPKFNPCHLDAYFGSATMLFRYIQSSAALRMVIFREGKSPSSQVTRYIRMLALTAVARNPHLTMFQVEMNLPAEPLAYLFSSAPSLKLLCMSTWDFDGKDAQADGVIAEGLASNKTLEHIELYRMRGASLAQAIVSRLATHPIATLRTLNLRSSIFEIVPVPHAFPQMVQSCRALEEVTFSCLSIQGDFWQSMYKALRASPSMKRLFLSDCIFDSKGTDGFLLTMQDPLISLLKAAPRNDTASADMVPAGWCGGELHLTIHDNVSMFAGASWARVIARLLTNRAAPLDVLSLNIRSDSLGDQSKEEWFFYYLSWQDDPEIHLRHLRMNHLHGKEWPYLVECLPRTAKLRELKIGNVYLDFNDKPINPNSFLAALLANGSLHVIAVGEDDEERDFMTPAQWRFAQACLERNRIVPTMLASENVTPALVPLLFAAAQAAPRTAPNVLFQSLLAATDADVDWSQLGRI